MFPGFLESKDKVLEFYRNLKDRALISVMVQYIPVGDRDKEIPEGKVSREEYEKLVDMLDVYGIDEGFLQKCRMETNGFRTSH